MYEGNAVGSFPTQEPEVRSSEVQSEISRLTDVTEQLDKYLSELESKLGSVLAQHKVGGNAEAQSAPTPLRVPLAETLHGRGDHVENLRQRVSSMVSRLEL